MTSEKRMIAVRQQRAGEVEQVELRERAGEVRKC